MHKVIILHIRIYSFLLVLFYIIMCYTVYLGKNILLPEVLL